MRELNPTEATADIKVQGDQVRIFQQQGLLPQEFALADAPFLLEDMLDEKVWLRRWDPLSSRLLEFDSFVEFATSPLSEGLAVKDRDKLIDICRGQPEIVTKVRKHWPMPKDALGEAHRPTKEEQEDRASKSRNTGLTREQSIGENDDAAYAEARLSKEKPELYARVLSGELSPHGAMVEAGFRPKRICVRSDIASAAQSLLKHFDPDELYAAMTERQRDE